MDRSYFRLSNPIPGAESCEKIASERKRGRLKLELEATDRLHLDVKVSEGREIGSWAGANKFDSREISEFIGGGPYGTGPLGTLIGDVFGNRGASFAFAGQEEIQGKRVYKYEYRVPLASSHYSVRSGDRRVLSGFSGAFWIDPAKVELKRLTADTDELPAETQACAVGESMDYETMRIGTGDFLVPQRSELRFFLRDGTEDSNSVTYAACRQYHGEATLRIDDGPMMSGDAPTASKQAAPMMTGGLPFTLALADSIDTETAAAGDAIAATVLKPGHTHKSDTAVIPAGSTVRGRVVRMEHLLGENPRFVVSILLESIDIGGVRMPFYAMPDDTSNAVERRVGTLRMRGDSIVPAPAGLPPTTATFVFSTTKSRYVVPRGWESKWLTLPPPPEDLETAPAPR